MSRPVIVAVEQDPRVLADVERQLSLRYDRDYRIECLDDPHRARQRFEEMRDVEVEVALVLVGRITPLSARDELLDLVRGLHPHAKRTLLVRPNEWMDPPTAAAIRTSMALGRIDHYV